jgi:hypothetical protein
MMIGQLTLKNAAQPMLDKFFPARVFGKNQITIWKIMENLPRKRKDTKFDKLLQQQTTLCHPFGETMIHITMLAIVLQSKGKSGTLKCPGIKWYHLLVCLSLCT